jgi:hypothetical protein
MPPFLVARKKSLPCWVMQPSSVFSFALLAVWLLSVVLLVLMPVLLWLELGIELVLLLGDVVLGDVVLGVVLWLVDPYWPVELELLLGV